MPDTHQEASGEPRDVTVVVGIRAGAHQAQRLRNARACLHALGRQSLDRRRYRLVVVEQDDAPRLEAQVAPLADSYCFAYNPGPFNRGWGFNIGAVQPGAEQGALCLIDADLLVPADFLQRGVQALLGGRRAVLPYHEVMYLDERTTERLLAAWEATGELAFRPENHGGRVRAGSVGGCIWIDGATYRALGGHNEEFRGWGAEDREFHGRLSRAAQVERLPGRIFHLHHPREAARPASYRRNRALYLRLKHAGFPPPPAPIGDPARYEAERPAPTAAAPARPRTQPDAPSEPHPTGDPAPPGARAGVSVVIPHAGRERLPQLAATLAAMRQCRGVTEIIVVELGAAPVACALARRWADTYVFARHTGAFQRTRALNIATPLAAADLLLWHDNDLLAPEQFVERAAAEMRERGLDFLIPYTAVHYLSPSDSDTVRRGVRDPGECRPHRTLHARREIVGGSGMVRAAFLRQYGGMHDGFHGWGAEDNAWDWKVRLLGSSAVTQRHDQHIYHLFHPLSGGYGNATPAARNPHYQRNLALLREMRAIESRERFLHSFPPPTTFSCPWTTDQRVVFLSDDADTDSARDSERGAQVLRRWYGVPIETKTLRRDDDVPEWRAWAAYSAVVVFGACLAHRLLSEPSYAPLRTRTLAVVDGPAGLDPEQVAPLGRGAALLALTSDVADALAEAGLRPWRCDGDSDGADRDRRLAIGLLQPLSLVVGHAAGQPDESPATAPAALPVWLYWEGERPAWIAACQQTIFDHGRDVRLLTWESFDALRDTDRDIDLSGLHVAHRADFVRAFVLMRYGGLWIDSDCIVMQPLDPVLALLTTYDFICHRERQGVFSNGFIGAAAGSAVAAAYYRHICALLRSGQRLGWSSIGGMALTQVLSSVSRDIWCELPCEQIQPICWSDPGAFFRIGDRRQHERAFNQEAICYMLSNQSIQRFVAAQAAPPPALLDERTFFSFLLERARSGLASERDTGDSEGQPSGAWLPPRDDPGSPRPPAAADVWLAQEQLRAGEESRSGPGSSRAQTATIRRRLPLLLADLQVESLLDLPCGDFNWMQHVRLGAIDYIGGDLLPHLVERNQRRFGAPRRRFFQLDLLDGPLPRADIVLCRDCLVHFSFADIARALQNIKRSGAAYLLTTTFTGRAANADIPSGEWRPLNLEQPPFSFPPPLRLIVERCTEAGGQYGDKSLACWRLSDLPI